MKKQTMQYFALFILFVSCSTMTLNIDSEPKQAIVFIKEGSILKKIGETPMSISSSELSQYKQYNLSIQKEGYKSHEVLIDKRALSARAEIYATLQKDLVPMTQAGTSENVDSQQRSLASIQSELLLNNYSQAEVLAKTFLNSSPYSPVGWNLLGNAYVLQNKNGPALEAYSRALEYDPENRDTQKMIEFLKGTPVRRDR